MPPKEPPAKGAKPALPSAAPDGAAGGGALAGASSMAAAAKVAADVAAAVANVSVPPFSPRPECLVEVQQIQDPESGLKDNFKGAFIAHCMSSDGNPLKLQIVKSFQSTESLASMSEKQMIDLWLEASIAQVESDCTGVNGEEPDVKDIQRADALWADIKRRVKAARLLQAPGLSEVPSRLQAFGMGVNFFKNDLYKTPMSGAAAFEPAMLSSSAHFKGEGKARAREDEDERKSFQAKKSKTAQTGGLKILQDRLQGKPRLSYILTPQMQLILACRHFIDNIAHTLLDLAGHGGTEAEMEVQEEIDALADKLQEALASFATCFAANDADNFNVTLAVADRFLNTGLGDFSDKALSSLGVTPDQLQVVGSVVKESKDAKQAKKKGEHDPKLWCVTCGRRGHEASTCFAKSPAPGYSPNPSGSQGSSMRRDHRDSPPPLRRRSRSPPRGGFYGRDRGPRSPRR